LARAVQPCLDRPGRLGVIHADRHVHASIVDYPQTRQSAWSLLLPSPASVTTSLTTVAPVMSAVNSLAASRFSPVSRNGRGVAFKYVRLSL